MKLGKVNKDGTTNAHFNQKEDPLLYDERFIVSILKEIISDCPDSKFFNETTEIHPYRIHLPAQLIGKIQTIGIIKLLKNSITRGECTTKRINDTAKTMLVSPNQALKEEKMKKSTPVSTSTLTYARAKVLVRKAGFRNIQKYVSLRTKGQLPAGLPSNPATAYARYWKGWTEFCGTTAK